jgi:hypothetical protein
MSQIKRLVILALAVTLSPLAVSTHSLAEPLRGQSVSSQYYQEPIEACKKEFDMPDVHVLPTGVGDVSVKACFNNGFTTLKPHTERVEECVIAVKSDQVLERGNIAYDISCLKKASGSRLSCRINCKDSPSGLKSKPECCPKKIKIIRRKYHCRFKGAGAVLGDTGEIRSSGSKVYFRGEGPDNFSAKDPSCKKIFDELFTKSNKYCYLK